MESGSTIKTRNGERDIDNALNEVENNTVDHLNTLYSTIADNNFTLFKSTIGKCGFDMSQGSQILHCICKCRNEANVVKYLHEAVRYGFDIRAKDDTNQMPIHAACSYANYHAVNFLADLDPSLCNEVEEGSTQSSPLMIAISKFTPEKDEDFFKTVDALLKHGADVNRRIRHHSHTPLLSAVCHSEKMPEIIRILLDAGADVATRSLMDRTPLILAVSQKDQQSVRYLLKAKSDPDAKDKMGLTPLRLACRKQYVSIIRDLVEYGADINCEISQNNREILIDAIQTSNYGITELLFKLGLKVTQELILQQNPVVCAIRKKSKEHLKILLQENCPLDEPLYQLPLIEAVQTNTVDTDVLSVLLQSGADFSDALLNCALTAKPDDETLASLVAQYHRDVRTLKALCCFSVRKSLGLGIKRKVWSLVEDHTIPRSLVKDVMLEHILNV
ncbi:ankyrin repeat and KH domain-containing protein 1-like [Ylistrum balloti]|uniref:ankyrin repeat and KH domain-containing protein 1-like n=1 Tax=Ylistrum balloti TaxID=509963 RepID=UPI00290591C7|nr:ankyrin repeat and KH domain-containing protein 1-like [Ylistrum balloti]